MDLKGDAASSALHSIERLILSTFATFFAFLRLKISGRSP
jgi:hypothetical protein